MEAARQHGIQGVVAQCGGACACATCHVYIDSAWLSEARTARGDGRRHAGNAWEPRENSRLSCQVHITADLDGLQGHRAATAAANEVASSRKRSKSLVSTCRPGRARISLIDSVALGAHRGLHFHRLQRQQHIALGDLLTGVHRDRGDGAGHGGAHMGRIARLDLAPRRPLRHLAAIRDPNRARLAVEFEEHRARAVLVRIAGGHVAHDQRLAALQIDVDLLPESMP
jgi:2Fe-2S ferredoxin